MRRLVAAALFAALPAVIARAQTDSGVFAEATVSAATVTTADPAVIRGRFVTVDLQQLVRTSPGGQELAGVELLKLNLFPDVVLTASLTRVERTATGYVWVGRLETDPFSSVTLSVSGVALVGSITTADVAYSVRPVEDGLHAVQEVNRGAFPPELPPVSLPDATPATVRPAETVRDDFPNIDVMVLYTPGARAATGGASAMQALIDLGISETNQAYANSLAAQRLRLVHTQEIAYAESGDLGLDLDRLGGKTDGWMDTIHSLRDQYGADLVHLLVATGNGCGIAYLMGGTLVENEHHGFAVSLHSCVSPNYTFAHELGHNMGVHHDIYMTGSTTTGNYPYSRGYVNDAAFAFGAPASKRWRDIMSYDNRCNAANFSCARLLYFSNPNVFYGFDRMGNADTADGVRTLNNTVTTVAKFRSAVDYPTLTVTPLSRRLTEGNSGTKNVDVTLTLSAPATRPVNVWYRTQDNYRAVGGYRDSIQVGTNPVLIGVDAAYPWTLDASGEPGAMTHIRVKLYGFSHTYPGDVDVLLVGPTGKTVMLMSDVGGANPVSDINLTFEDGASPLGTGTLASGTYRPTNLEDNEGDDVFGSPAPAGPYGASLSVFDGTDPGGLWRLYLRDDFAGDVGSIRGGWSIELSQPRLDYIGGGGVLTIPAGSTSTTLSFPIIGDTNVEENETFRFEVREVFGAKVSPGSAEVMILADDASFTDDPLTTTTPVKALHIQELRTLINETIRIYRGLERFSFTDPNLESTTTKVKAVHIDELRRAVADVYTAAGQPAPTYTDPTIIPGVTPIRRVHIEEIRQKILQAP
jgi:peptidyl-Asp metalloendopeptidase